MDAQDIQKHSPPGSSSVGNGQGSPYLETQLASIAKTMQDMRSAMQALSQKRGPTDEGGDEVPVKRARSVSQQSDEESDEEAIESLLDKRSNSDPESEESGLLGQIVQDLDYSEPLGPKINDKLAKTIDKCFTSTLTSEKVKGKHFISCPYVHFKD